MQTKHKISDAECIDALRLIKEHGSMRAAATAAGVDRDVIRRRSNLAKERHLTADTVLKDPLAAAKIEIAMLKRAVKDAQHTKDTAESIRQEIYNIASYSPEPPKWLTVHRKGSGTPGAPMTIWSDWHYGEVVRKAETAGQNEYNSDIAQARIKRLADRTIRLVKGFAFKEAGKDVQFPGIVVMLGGDMISGDIHEELADTNDRKPFECVNDLVDILIAALTQMADAFGMVYVPCVVGNHGRTSKRPRMKGRVITSYEWNLYCQLERHFLNNDPRVHIDVSAQTDVLIHCMGHRFLLTHGDSIGAKGGDGMIGAIGPIKRGSMKVGNSEAQIGRDFDTLVVGHYHSGQPRGALFPVIVNDSIKGYDEYARLEMRVPFSRPAQMLWFVHPEQGITAQLPVYVDDVKKPRKPKPFIMVPR